MAHPLKGRKQSPEHIAARVAARIANDGYKGDGERIAALNKSRTGSSLPEEHKAKIAASMKGKQNCLGHKPTVEHRRKLSEYWLAHPEQHNFRIDGNGHKRRGDRRADMGRIEYRLWRHAVFERDDWTCVKCRVRGGKLHADHIKPYAQFPELRYELTNGRTLCVTCHLQEPTHGKGSKGKLE